MGQMNVSILFDEDDMKKLIAGEIVWLDLATSKMSFQFKKPESELKSVQVQKPVTLKSGKPQS